MTNLKSATKETLISMIEGKKQSIQNMQIQTKDKLREILELERELTSRRDCSVNQDGWIYSSNEMGLISDYLAIQGIYNKCRNSAVRGALSNTMREMVDSGIITLRMAR